jgi:hypothetical protein
MLWIPAKTTSKNCRACSSGLRNATALRATITHTVDGAVAEESKRRFVDWRFEQPGGTGLGILRSEDERRAHGPDVPRDFYLSSEDTEQAVRLWHEGPDRWREEILTSKGEIRRCVVFGGARGPRWVYEPPETAVYDPAGTVEWPGQDPRRTPGLRTLQKTPSTRFVNKGKKKDRSVEIRPSVAAALWATTSRT